MGFDLHSDEGCYVAPNVDTSTTNYLDIGSLELHNFAWIIAGACSIAACILSFHLIYKHLSNYTKPEHQKHIVRILLMVPIYAIDSFLSFRFYWLSVYFDVIRDCYEAFVIHSFYSLLVEYVGGYDHGKEIFSRKDEVKLVFPFSCISIRPKRGLMRQCKRLTLQYVVLRPSMTLFAVILHSNSEFCPGNWSPLRGYLYFMVVNFFSVTIAMYALVLFASASHDLIQQYKPVSKFLSVKFIIMLSFWQAVIVSGLVMSKLLDDEHRVHWTTDNVATGIQNALLCLEMLIAATWHFWAFTYKDFELGMKTGVFASAANVFSPTDVVQDVYHSFVPLRKKDLEERRQGFVQLAKSENEGESVVDGADVRVSVDAPSQSDSSEDSRA